MDGVISPTLAVARKLVAYMLAIEKSKKDFQITTVSQNDLIRQTDVWSKVL